MQESNLDELDKCWRNSKPELDYEEKFNPEFDFSEKYCDVQIDINFDSVGTNWKALNGDREEVKKFMARKKAKAGSRSAFSSKSVPMKVRARACRLKPP